eukprot:symbB.v1.2.017764.t1/scaffold1355.1/size123688/6
MAMKGFTVSPSICNERCNVGQTGNGTCRTTVHPKMAQLKRMLRRLKNEGNASTVTELLTAVRSRCPHWAVTYGYVRKVLAIMEREKEEEGDE